jgi:selenide,water dikinase
MELTYKLTEYSKGAGCGCKIAPSVLEEILKSILPIQADKNLLVGNGHNDDAAVYDLGNNMALISTTDFFMPMVDDAFTFGKIAAANAISDVYAMGGNPLMAIAILGWPVEKLPAHLAQQVLDGARSICNSCNITLAGGHSVDSLEPFFGLSVNGMVAINNLKKNNTAEIDDVLFLTKPIGVGILSTAQKRNLISEEDATLMASQMCTLNTIGAKLATINGVHAMTDVTGFGLLGHLIEICEASNCSAELIYKNVPILPEAIHYLTLKAIPDATYRNWNSYSKKVSLGKDVNVMESFSMLPDPQTNGGILFSCNASCLDEVIQCLKENDLQDFIQPIGKIKSTGDKVVEVI